MSTVLPEPTDRLRLTKTLVESRNQAVHRLVEHIRASGAHPAPAMRFDVTEGGGNGAEICAYRTAAIIGPPSSGPVS